MLHDHLLPKSSYFYLLKLGVSDAVFIFMGYFFLRIYIAGGDDVSTVCGIILFLFEFMFYGVPTYVTS